MGITTILLVVLVLLVLVNLGVTFAGKAGKPDEGVHDKLKKIDAELARIDPLIRDEFARNRDEQQRSSAELRTELNRSFGILSESLGKTVTYLSSVQKTQLETFSNRLAELSKSFDEKTKSLQEQQEKAARDNRTEQRNAVKAFSQETGEKLREIRDTVEGKLKTLQEDNSLKLEQMRKTVDEKLQETVERRFAESFKLISDRLEQVHKGLGEMQTLASGVGDLKKVLTNVKTRGNLGEIQLGAILEQILSPEQYAYNAAVKVGSAERVEYVVKLPGKNADNKSLLLPIDSKFPNEDYQRLVDAYDNAEAASPRNIEIISKQFEASVKRNARVISEKYINAPVTTDFAIMFVPTESLYAEILRRTGLFEALQRDYKVTVVGPTNLVAFLSSLQMGFKTLAIERRSSEVWEILGAVKTEFGSFGDILAKTKKKLEEATRVIDSAGVRTRAIERKLKNVQELPSQQRAALLGEAVMAEQGVDKEEGPD